MASRTRRMHTASKSGCLLVDTFEGALSDFADETIVDSYPTEDAAIEEVMERVDVISQNHRGMFATDDAIDAFASRDIRSELKRKGWVRYISEDGCRYVWRIVPAPSVSQSKVSA